MERILMMRDALSRFYGKYDMPIRLLCKFLLAFWVFFEIRSDMGAEGIFGKLIVILILAVLCTFLPSNGIILIAACMLMAYFYSVSLETAVVGGMTLVIGMLVYFSISSRSAYPLIITALAVKWEVGCASAVLFGLMGGPLTAVGVAFGALVPNLTETLVNGSGNLQSSATDAAEIMVQKMAALMKGLLSNREMVALAVILTVIMLLVYMIRIMEIKYAWTLAAGTGIFVYALLRMILGITGILDTEAIRLVIEIVAAALLAAAAQLMFFSLDYKKTENLRFEDDEYYYYVKAVPKKKIKRKRRNRRSEGR